MNTATVYNVTTKEYMDLGKIGSDFFCEVQDPESLQKFFAFLCNVRLGHDIRILLDNCHEVPEGFYDGDFEPEDSRYTHWTEIKLGEEA